MDIDHAEDSFDAGIEDQSSEKAYQEIYNRINTSFKTYVERTNISQILNNLITKCFENNAENPEIFIAEHFLRKRSLKEIDLLREENKKLKEVTAKLNSKLALLNQLNLSSSEDKVTKIKKRRYDSNSECDDIDALPLKRKIATSITRLVNPSPDWIRCYNQISENISKKPKLSMSGKFAGKVVNSSSDDERANLD